MIYPVVLGAGERPFGGTSDKKPMQLLNTRTVAGDLAYVTYEPVRDAFWRVELGVEQFSLPIATSRRRACSRPAQGPRPDCRDATDNR